MTEREYRLPFTASILEAKLNAIDKKIGFEKQELSEEQKIQARKNIGAISQEDVNFVLPEDVLKYSEQSLSEEEKAQARANIGAISADDIPAFEIPEIPEMPEIPENLLQYSEQILEESEKRQARTNIGAAMEYSYGTEDLVAGETPLENGKLHFVYV